MPKLKVGMYHREPQPRTGNRQAHYDRNSARHQLPVREGRIISCTEFIFMLIFNMSGAKRHSVNLACVINPGSRTTPPGVPPLVEVTRTTLCTSLRQGCVSGLGALITSFSRA